MLKQLFISNIILIESAEINFCHGFNILSGETGSGKSAILHALHLVMGNRADSSLVRNGSEKGFVIASFDISKNFPLMHFLDEAGIEHDKEEDLVIKREINVQGKARAFVNNQAIQVNTLKQISGYLIDLAGQHANQRLFSLDFHRAILDLYGSLKKNVVEFSASWSEEQELRRKLDTLVNSEGQRLREIEVCLMELEELENAKLKEHEEEDLFKEYTLLSNAEEMIKNLTQLTNALTHEKNGILVTLKRHFQNLENLAALDLAFKDLYDTYNSSFIELQDIAYTLNTYYSRLENNPERHTFIEERLSLISKLKKKYGSTLAEIEAYREKAKKRLCELESFDTYIEAIRIQLLELQENNNKAAEVLTLTRKQAAKELEKALVHHLKSLNMPKVELEIKITHQARNKNGDDKVEIFLIPNVGEASIPIRECASGGELSRVMLSLQTLLAGKENIPTLVFDEIDANIGGATAAVVGEKLREIGGNHQVICITHFPQVAKNADHHLHIYKQEIEGRTVTHVQSLDRHSRKKELARMQGLI